MRKLIEFILLWVAFGGNGHPKYDANAEYECHWKHIPFFDDKKVIKIRTGHEHTFCIEDNGDLWCCGDNAFGQFGVGHSEEFDTFGVILENKWFKENNIQIKDIQCGLYHSLALDQNGRVYSWGHSKRGQCGHGSDVLDLECIETPKLIEYFKSKIKQISCGNYHSCCKTSSGLYYLFGSNQHNQCMTFAGNSKVTVPFCINDIIKQKTKRRVIKGVYLGCNNTKIIVYWCVYIVFYIVGFNILTDVAFLF